MITDTIPTLLDLARLELAARRRDRDWLVRQYLRSDAYSKREEDLARLAVQSFKHVADALARVQVLEKRHVGL